MTNADNWRTVPTESGSIFEAINQFMEEFCADYSNALPDFRSVDTVFITSDYSGEHKCAEYFVLAFLFADLHKSHKWHKAISEIRAQLIRDGRRMSFKTLRDKQKLDALYPFLSAADNIPGICIAVAIDKSINTIFKGSPPIDLSNPAFADYRGWSVHTLNKAFTIINFLSFYMAGLCRPLQNIYWLTDQDSIAANPLRLKQLTNLFAWVSSTYLTYDMGKFRCGTTQCDNGSRVIEDLASIPDLVAGAIAENIGSNAQLDLKGKSQIFWLQRGDLSKKTNFISWWLTKTEKPLKRLLLILDASGDTEKTNVSFLHFHDRH